MMLRQRIWRNYRWTYINLYTTELLQLLIFNATLSQPLSAKILIVMRRTRKAAFVKFRNLENETSFANFVCLFHFEGERPAKFSLKPRVPRAKSFRPFPSTFAQGDARKSRKNRATCHREIRNPQVITLVRWPIYTRTRDNRFHDKSSLFLWYLCFSKTPPNSVSRRNGSSSRVRF